MPYAVLTTNESGANSLTDINANFALAMPVNSVILTSTTGTVTVVAGTHIYRANAVSGAITYNLPAASSSTGLIFTFKKIDSSVNVVTIDGSGSEKIDGQLTKVLSTQYSSAQLCCNGTNWDIII